MQQQLWMTERQTDGYALRWRIERVLHEEQTPYQFLKLVELTDFGRALVLDDVVQVTVKDEYIYHEMIAHVPLFAHPNPQRVLVIGGGDGGTVREVLRHPEVEAVDLVEIDARVIELSQVHLPELTAALGDPRCRIVIADGIEYVKNQHNIYDVILVDSSDPVGPAVGLFQRPFYQDAHRALKDGGVFVCQSESPFFNADLIRDVHMILSDLYAHTSPYLCCVPTYPSGYWSFTIASKCHDFAAVQPRRQFPTRYYDAEVHRAAFALPPFLRRLLSSGMSGHQ